MKKYLLMIVTAFALAFTSCSNSKEIDIVYKHNLSLSIKTANICEYYGLANFQNLLGNGYNMGVTTLLYNSQGKLYIELHSHENNLQPINQNIPDLEQGDYTLINIQYIVKSNNNESPVWTINDIDDLSTAKIVSKSKQILWYNCLGIHSETIKIDSDKSLNINPDLYGALIDFEYENFDNSKYNWLGLEFKNAADGFFLNPELSKTESYYYSDGYTENNTWEGRAHFYSKDGLLDSDRKTVFVIETGNINCCIAPSNYSGIGDIPFDGTYPSETYNLNISTGNIYKAYSFYKGEPEVMETYIGTSSGYSEWYQKLDKNLNPLFVHPNTSWGISVNKLKSYMQNNGYKIWYDIEKRNDGLYYLGYYPLHKENSIQYIFETESTNLLNSYVNISEEKASIEDIRNQLNKSNEYTFYKYDEENDYYIYYNKQTLIGIFPNQVFDSGTEYTQLLYVPNTSTETRSAFNQKVHMNKLNNARNNH